MRKQEAEKLARRKFGPNAYAIYWDRWTNGYEPKNPCRIGRRISDTLNEPLGCGTTWVEAFSAAEKTVRDAHFKSKR